MLEKYRDKKIVVLMGGRSREREISLKSGKAILASLQRQGYEVSAIEADECLAERLTKAGPSAAIVALHGRYGEDGSVQGMLEVMGIPFSGSGVLASAICIDKALTKLIVSGLGVSVPLSCTVKAADEVSTACRDLKLTVPVVVKPNREGSTLGTRIVQDEHQLEEAVHTALGYDKKVLIEDYIQGTEITVGLINGRTLPALEVVPTSGFYDYEAKYTPGMTEYIVPARIAPDVADRVERDSLHLADMLGLEGVARADFIINSDGTPYFLEVNTVPGMTETSLVPKAAAYAGISFDELVENMLESCRLKI